MSDIFIFGIILATIAGMCYIIFKFGYKAKEKADLEEFSKSAHDRVIKLERDNIAQEYDLRNQERKNEEDFVPQPRTGIVVLGGPSVRPDKDPNDLN